jgi:CTP:molybdopterin cytidylyltransferase MocA
VVLAAGRSSRFGSTKQLAQFDGEALVARAARAARQACGEFSALVVGHDAQRVIDAAGPGCEFLLVNDRYEQGLGSSISQAARTLAPAADALLVTLADQPHVDASHLSALIDAWSGDLDEIVATRYSGTRGVPALFPAATFSALASLYGDRGAQRLLSDGNYAQKSVELQAASIDIDRPEDLA